MTNLKPEDISRLAELLDLLADWIDVEDTAFMDEAELARHERDLQDTRDYAASFRLILKNQIPARAGCGAISAGPAL